MKVRDLLDELRKLSIEELHARARSTAEELLKLRCRAVSGQTEKGHLFSELKRNLARTMTVLNQKRAEKAS